MIHDSQRELAASTSFITARCSFGSIRNAVRASRGKAAGSLACMRFWILAIGRTSSTELSPIMKPQHSLGNSRSACATIASILARRIDAVHRFSFFRWRVPPLGNQPSEHPILSALIPWRSASSTILPFSAPISVRARTCKSCSIVGR